MATINIDDEVLKSWEEYWQEHDRDEYPSLKNFTNKKLKELMNVIKSE